MRLGEWKRLLLSVDSWDYQQMVRTILYVNTSHFANNIHLLFKMHTIPQNQWYMGCSPYYTTDLATWLLFVHYAYYSY